MKLNSTLRSWPVVCCLLLVASLSVFAQGTAFTYQGRLDIAGTPANSTNDLTFTLYDAVSAGATVGTSNTFNDLVITNGLLTVTLDFGAGAFAGANRWLQIAARPGPSTGAYTNLAPRIPITPTPYAIFAGGAAAAGVTGTLPATALSGAYSGSVNLSNAANSFAGNGSGLTSLNAANLTSGTVADARLSANVALLNRAVQAFTGGTNSFTGTVGIGTATPGAKLDVVGSSGTSIRVTGPGGNGATVALDLATFDAGVSNGPSTRIQATDGNYSGSLDFQTKQPGAATNAMASRLFIQNGGNVGIGTPTPGAKLEVSDGATSLRVIPGTLNGVANPNAVTLDIPGVSTLGIWDNLKVSAGLEVAGDVTVGAGKQLISTGRLHVQSSAGEPLYLNPFGGGADVIIGGGGAAPNLQVVGEVYCVAVNITSDRNAKEQFKPVNAREVLAKVARLPITEWQYKAQGDARHIGPMAQDFREAFALGHDEKHITSVDADGVALAAIQGLNEKLDETRAENLALKQTVEELKALVNKIAGQQNGGAK